MVAAAASFLITPLHLFPAFQNKIDTINEKIYP
jgi:hypothetical protein